MLLVVAAVRPVAVEEQFDSALPVVQLVAVVAAAVAVLFEPAFALVGSFSFSYQYCVPAAEVVA